MSEYNGDAIEVLEELEPVRVRPGMYIGSTGSKGLHHLIWEIIDNGIDEHLAGFGDQIRVMLHLDGSVSVQDEGRGMPVDLNTKKKISAERLVFTVLHAGGKFNRKNYNKPGGLHGVGASVVNALSTWLEVTIERDGYRYYDRYENGGKPIIPLQDGLLPAIGTSDRHGTLVRFMPDSRIFDTIEFKPEIIKKRMKELAYLNKNLILYFDSEVTDEHLVFHERDGIVGLIRDLNKTKELLHDEVIYFSGSSNDIDVEIAFQFSKEFNETIFSFCNGIDTVEGGTHVSGFKSALTRVLNQYAKESGTIKDKESFDGRDARNGITAIVVVRHPEPQFEGQTKTKLGNDDAKNAVDEVLSQELRHYLDRNPDIQKIMLDNALRSLKLRKAEEKVRANFLNSNNSFTSNGKLATCTTKDATISELILVEGDSAGGSAKQGRDRFFQAILPLKGKVINVEKRDISKIISNSEIASLILAIGAGFGEGFGNDFDINKTKYSKIIILTDADVDGSHIRILLLTFFYRYMPELIYEGKIYFGVPPLYKWVRGKEVGYCYSDKELEDVKTKTKSKLNIQRYKGLGEMNPGLLWETTLNPATRLLKKVTIEDAINADEITNVLMGDVVAPRRDFIYENALLADVDW